LAKELGVPKIIYTSTVAVFGNTRGLLCDESYQPPESPFLTEYDRTKWKAHYEVALPLIQEGAPVIVVMPGGVYGPGDPSLVGDFMKGYYKGLFPVLPGPELVLTFAHVDDVAEGHILAAEKGVPGESYILAGPAASIGEVVKIWASVTGRPAPYFYIPARFVKPLAPVMGILGSILPLPQLISRDVLTILDACYRAEADKAREQLGWSTRPLEEGMRATFEWIAQTEKQASPASRRRYQIAGFLITAALGLLIFRLFNRKRNP
jgi:nucleoside-diphosphate-sugar epimerase